MDKPELIFCAAGSKRFSQIAVDAGFLYGARLPGTANHPVYFSDQDWKRPDRAAYMKALEQHRPTMATVLDWERKEQRDEVLSWAEEAAQYVKRVLIVPKVIGGIETLPRKIGSADVVLAYSVPTRYGGTFVPAWEFDGWPVHLLGGSPHKQMEYAHYFDTMSVDGNYHMLKATRFCEYWERGRWFNIQSRETDAPYRAFERSCHNIATAWKSLKNSG